jgi:hypothetical protein
LIRFLNIFTHLITIKQASLRKFIILFLISILIILSAKSQEFNNSSNDCEPVKEFISAGLGIGLDYGGFGVNLYYFPEQNIGVFAGAGYTLLGLAYNLGAKYRFYVIPSEAGVWPFITAMYGSNSLIVVENASKYNKMFYGPSIGCGIDFKLRPDHRAYLSISIIKALKNPDLEDYKNDLNKQYGVDFKNDYLPIVFSIGCKFILNRY